MKLHKLIIILYLFSSTLSTNLPSGFRETRVAKDINPVSIVMHPTQDIIYIVQKGGVILGVKSETMIEKPILDLSHKVDNSVERGLQCMSFDPDFEKNNYIYFYYALADANRNIVARYTLKDDSIDPKSEKVILELEPIPSPAHNGGQLLFLENKLYIFTGDGTIGDNAWRMDKLLGKVLRFNLDGTIPEDNPFYNVNSGIYRSIYAYGLRNPFMGAILPGTNRIFFGDVGDKTWEEINELLPGKNYGWPMIEGKIPEGMNPPLSYKDPVHVYKHVNGNCAIVGAMFYTSKEKKFPQELEKKFFFADYCFGEIRTLDPSNNEVESFATGISRPVALALDHNGNMYYATRASSHMGNLVESGELFKVEYTSVNAPHFSIQPTTITVVQGQPTTFYAEVSGQGPIKLQWKKNGNPLSDANLNYWIVESPVLQDNDSEFLLEASNEYGITKSQIAKLKVVENFYLKAQILNPKPDHQYKANEVIEFEGFGTDKVKKYESAFLTWEILFHHDDHVHPLMPKIKGVDKGTYKLSFNEAAPNVWYEIILTVTDERGISVSASRNIFPIKSACTFETDPPGLILELDSVKYTTPFQFESTAGIFRKIVALNQTHKGVVYKFDDWSDGKKESEFHFSVPERDATFKAYFSRERKVVTGARYMIQDGKFDDIPEFPADIQTTGKLTSTLAPIEEKNGNFAVRYVTFINITYEGLYTFYANSNGGSRLRIRGSLVFENNNPQHKVLEFSGNIYLFLGSHYLEVSTIFSDLGASIRPVLEIKYSSPDINKRVIPDKILYAEDPNPCLPQRFKNVAALPKIFDYSEKGNKLKIRRFVSSELPVTFTIEGPATFQYINKFERWIVFNGEPGPVTITSWSRGDNLYCPSVTLKENFTVANPNYVEIPKMKPVDRSTELSIIGVVVSVIVFLIGCKVYRQFKNSYANLNDVEKKEKSHTSKIKHENDEENQGSLEDEEHEEEKDQSWKEKYEI